MSNSRQYSLQDCHFPAELTVGFIRIANADQLPLAEAYLRVEGDEAAVRLNWKDPSTTDWAMVVISMFRLPGGEKEFTRVREFFGARKQRIRLPEGVPFRPEHNAFTSIPASWTHDAWAESKYELRHTYQHDKLALFVRWSGTRSAMITHPLFSMVRDNVRIVEDQWETALPEVIRNAGVKPEFTTRAIDAALQIEIRASAQRARGHLGLAAESTFDMVPQAVRLFLEQGRINIDRKALAIELGALWGEALCAATGWGWRSLQRGTDSIATVICSPNDSHFVDPIRTLHTALQSKAKGRGDYQELLFNLIRAGNLIGAADGALHQLI